ncbi:MAG: NUDIX domain-containing protein [Candidatus Omnitrophica bacterium]|nr:NUDIX domain-containing protein [Candidatus Omnitrophota bacterium]
MPHIHELYDFVVSVFIVHQERRGAERRALLVYHKKYREWLPIGGHIELDEDPEQALYREIEEESGLRVKILAETPPVRHKGVKPIPTPSFVDVHEIDRAHKHIAFIYCGTARTPAVRLHEREHAEYRWFNRKELADPKWGLTPSIRFYCLEAMKKAAGHGR